MTKLYACVYHIKLTYFTGAWCSYRGSSQNINYMFIGYFPKQRRGFTGFFFLFSSLLNRNNIS